ncbi:MAG: holo-[acyl-carrier-protein] synthase [Omnitrophica bacterium RIFCSPLOWO2_12_FULL_44_17]|uniref:Holo-[acyl-carrier-protein] synthase n=1 Tax=Candidatus Danuiimicrobium aquiferis TaxID=1801832 RepID=A0A1G1KRG6_9BACT|nr:MAG: holo-[acyl-carrier-protein] synthase [Omnitrophica bacterium RIFCSPLOWO2_12_FULL_44_17]OGX01850.1 MAG: holo-[acyl-carrier-protein] synthase [Omnitrophica bacterium RIFCSPLOWO2_02_FULL_44_11]
MNSPFQLGVDIVSVRRMAEAIERSGQRFLDRVFTKAEQAYCHPKRNKYENYAARFAAKEAVIKAKKGGPGRYSFREIEVVRGERGEPLIHITTDARKRFKIPAEARFEVSLTHEREFAVAVVVMYLG